MTAPASSRTRSASPRSGSAAGSAIRRRCPRPALAIPPARRTDEAGRSCLTQAAVRPTPSLPRTRQGRAACCVSADAAANRATARNLPSPGRGHPVIAAQRRIRAGSVTPFPPLRVVQDGVRAGDAGGLEEHHQIAVFEGGAEHLAAAATARRALPATRGGGPVHEDPRTARTVQRVAAHAAGRVGRHRGEVRGRRLCGGGGRRLQTRRVGFTRAWVVVQRAAAQATNTVGKGTGQLRAAAPLGYRLRPAVRPSRRPRSSRVRAADGTSPSPCQRGSRLKDLAGTE